MNIHLEHQVNKRMQYQIKIAKTYDHFFSDVLMNDINGNQQPITYKSSVNLRKVREAIKALIYGGANGGIGGEHMTLIGFHPEHKKSILELQEITRW